MVSTRRSARPPRSPSPSATPTTDASALFSSTVSLQSSPATSDGGRDAGSVSAKRAPTRPVPGAAGKKRAAVQESESDDELAVVEKAPKRRVLSRQVYVELPRLKGRIASIKAESLSAAIVAPSPKGKGKAKAVEPVSDDDDVELLSDESLDYDEHASVQESDGSGSEFEVSDADDSAQSASAADSDDDAAVPVPVAARRAPRTSPRKRRGRAASVDSDDLDALELDMDVVMAAAAAAGDEDEDEDLVLDSAVRLSLETARLEALEADGAGAGPSSAARRGVPVANPAAVLRAAAAERRLEVARMQRAREEAALSELDALSLSESESEGEPLARGKGKGRGRGKNAATGKGNGNGKDTGKGTGKGKAPAKARRRGKVVTLTDLSDAARAARKRKAEKNKMVKQEEHALKLQLGRKLTWAEKNTIALYREHAELKDVWGDLEAKVVPVAPQKAEQPANLKVTLLPFQQESLFWMRKQEQSVWKGGMLADEMGMGKTIQVIALLVTANTKPNLVVAPTVAVMQWRNEIEAHTDGMKVLVWHGSARESNINELKKYDVVLTTYAVLESSFRKQHSGFKRKGQYIKEKSAMHQIEWERVILDEAHNIKERSTNTAKATFELKAKFKWCLSGTPLQNRVGELYSLIRFIGVDPFAYYYCKQCDCKSLHWSFKNKKNCDQCGCTPMQHTCFWNNEILSPIQKNGMVGPGKLAFRKLRVLLDRMMLRRTKVERADDLGLPPRTVIVRRDYFSPEEKELYLSLFSDAKRQFSTFVDSGTVLNNYSNIFSLLTRMRQMACHPDLVLRSKNNKGKFLAEDPGEATLCRLCNDIAEDAIMAKCHHIFDRECIKQYLNTAVEQTPDCPVCHIPLTIDLEAPALELEENVAARQGILGRLDLDRWHSSTKIEALVEELTNLRKQDTTTKSIVFSQFVNFLDLIAYRLQRAGFVICRLEGNMSPTARDLTIKHFMNNVHVTVFLVSLKAGGVALNLTEANRVYLMDSWWNPAVEFQAMDRIHRLGQHRPVQAIKLVVEDSIESRIIQLQEKKSAMVDATLSTDDTAMGRLTPEDLGFLFRL